MAMTCALTEGVRAMRPFLPARDFALSRRFYADLGFTIEDLGADLAQLHLGQHMFLLQNYYVEAWAGNFMMHMIVDDVFAWWTHIDALDLVGRYGVREPGAPKREPWGLDTCHVFDPSGVLWRIASEPQLVKAMS